MSSLTFRTLADLSDQLSGGHLSSVELTQAVIARTQAVDGQVKAFNFF